MSTTTKNVLLLVGGLIAAYVVLGLVLKLALGILGMIMPVLIVGGVIYVLYLTVGRKALGGGRRTLP
jgi:hypothetical protein